MQYRRVDDHTIQCIVSEEDMNERGLTIGDLLTKSDVAEGFLRELIEEAHDTIGYEIKGASISLQITPLQDDGMIITITNDESYGLRGFLEHIRDVMQAIVGGSVDELFEGLSSDQETIPAQIDDDYIENDQPEDIRIFEFKNMDELLEFASDGFASDRVKSCLGMADDKYYLVVTKNRCSWKDFNKLSAKAFDYSNVIPDIKGKLVYLSEHGESLIDKGALGKLKKIAGADKNA